MFAGASMGTTRTRSLNFNGCSRHVKGFQVDRRKPKYPPMIAFHHSSRYAQLRRGRGSCQVQKAIDSEVRYLQQLHSLVRTALPRGTRVGSGHTCTLVCTTPTNLYSSRLLKMVAPYMGNIAQHTKIFKVINKIEHSWA